MGSKKPSAPAVQKPVAPDYKQAWKQYSGELANINRRNEGELAAVRARLSAAGASPELIKMQSEHLESQRKRDVDILQGGASYGLLKEGYEIGRGERANPYEGDASMWGIGTKYRTVEEQVKVQPGPGTVRRHGDAPYTGRELSLIHI